MTLQLPFNDATGKFDAGKAAGFALAVVAVVVAARAIPFTAKLVK